MSRRTRWRSSRLYTLHPPHPVGRAPLFHPFNLREAADRAAAIRAAEGERRERRRAMRLKEAS